MTQTECCNIRVLVNINYLFYNSVSHYYLSSSLSICLCKYYHQTFCVNSLHPFTFSLALSLYSLLSTRARSRGLSILAHRVGRRPTGPHQVNVCVVKGLEYENCHMTRKYKTVAFMMDHQLLVNYYFHSDLCFFYSSLNHFPEINVYEH